MTRTEQTVVYAANRGYALFSSRRRLIERMLERGWRVVIATAPDEYADRLVDGGAILEPVIFDRSGVAPSRDLAAFLDLRRIHRLYEPRLVHHFHAKPLILGTAAARSTRGTLVVNTVTGLGHAFIEGGLPRHMAAIGYRLVLPSADATIFLNRDDRDLFLRHRWVKPERSRLIVGSGVDIGRFNPTRDSDGRRVVLMIGRLLWQKGVGEYVAAAEAVRAKHPEVIFRLAGEWDPAHPDAVSERAIRDAENRGTIEFVGYVPDVGTLFAGTSVFVLPSYREGVPRVLLEAAACGIPSVAFDVPGSREVIIDGETGLLVSERSGTALAGAILRLVEDQPLCERLGLAARTRAESEFDLEVVLEQTLDVYRHLGIQV